ncbi:chaperone NapD [Shewanella sp. GXUN23E]|uniref:chaperone NapD n=1 Tax=Shewanella sp. GXUN23E TaxID=3422498 RepID=UPI003D7ECD09
MSYSETHISSLVVHARPGQLAQVKAAIERIDHTEIWGDNPDGKIVVVVEAESPGFITDVIEKINNLPSVLSTVMVYHQIDNGTHHGQLIPAQGGSQ